MYSRFWVFPVLVTTLWCATPLTATAQIIPDRTLGSENSVVTPNLNIRNLPSDRIDGGAIRGSNLFHSFQEFNIEEGRGAYFYNPDNIVNILTRVTGGNISEILGTLGIIAPNGVDLGNANLFLINPNGIVFGPNARLDVGGSFFASTADGVLFENEFEFAASNPEAPPLLTINIPLGLNIRENPGRIVNQVIPVDSEDNFTGLEVPSGNSLVLLGGEINIDGGGIFVPGGRIELAGLSSGGTVGLNVDDNNRFSLSFPDNIAYANLTLSNDAKVTLGGKGGGDIVVNANTFNATDGGGLIAFTEAVGDEVDITVNANSINLSGINADSEFASSFSNFIVTDDAATVGNIFINTGNLSLKEGATILSNSSGLGEAGSIHIQASEAVSLSNSEILSGTVDSQGSDITIETGSLFLTESARLFSVTFGQGNAGHISIQASGGVSLVGGAILSSTDVNATGTGGNVNIKAPSVSMVDSNIFLDTEGAGNSGNIFLQATDQITLTEGSIVITDVEVDATGKGGNITVETGRLDIRDGSSLVAVTTGLGNGGNLTVNANDIELTGTSVDGETTSSLRTRVLSGATGNAGDVTISTGNLRLLEGAQISTVTSGSGNAGNITITGNQIEVIGTDINDEPSFISNQTNSTAASGSLAINTKNPVCARWCSSVCQNN